MSDDATTTEPTTPTTVAELQAVVSGIEAAEPAELKPTARGYTRNGGFRAYSPVADLPIQTLLSMGACINSAIAGQVADGVEGAQEALDLLVAHAGEAVTAQAHEAQFLSFLGMAVNLGYGDDAGIAAGSDLGSIEMPERDICEDIVDAFLASQPKVAQNSWEQWVAANS